MQKGMKVLYTAELIADKVRGLGRQIERDYDGGDPLLLGLLSGSVVFVADLVRAVRRPLRFEFVRVDYEEHEAPEDVLEIHFPIPVEVEGESLLLVKDVVKSGIIETYLRQQFLERGAREVRFAALVDLPQERKIDFEVDYSAICTQHEGMFVGYGLKRHGEYGNLPYIGDLTEAPTA